MENQPQQSGWKLDKTINLPLLVSLLTVVVVVTARLSSVEAKADKAVETAARVENQQAAQSVATTQQIAAMRAELRVDVKEVSGKVDQLVLRLGDRPSNLREWTK